MMETEVQLLDYLGNNIGSGPCIDQSLSVTSRSRFVAPNSINSSSSSLFNYPISFEIQREHIFDLIFFGEKSKRRIGVFIH